MPTVAGQWSSSHLEDDDIDPTAVLKQVEVKGEEERVDGGPT